MIWQGFCNNAIFFFSSLIRFLLVQVRKELGIAEDVKVVIFNFGGQVCRIYFVGTGLFFFFFSSLSGVTCEALASIA